MLESLFLKLSLKNWPHRSATPSPPSPVHLSCSALSQPASISIFLLLHCGSCVLINPIKLAKVTKVQTTICLNFSFEQHHWKMTSPSQPTTTSHPSVLLEFATLSNSAQPLANFPLTSGDINSSANLGVYRAKSIMGLITNQPLGIPTQQIQLARPRQIRLVEICNKSKLPVYTTLITNSPLCHHFARRALLGVRVEGGREGGVQTMASHFAINFLPITTRGWLDGADSFAAFSIFANNVFRRQISAKSNVDRVAVG